MFNFNFFEKGLGPVSPTYFGQDFSRKTFLALCSINWPNFIVRITLPLQIPGNVCIVLVCYPVCDVMDFEICLSILINPLSYMSKNLEQQLKYCKNKKCFYGKINKEHFSSFLMDFRLLKLFQTW